MTKTRTSKGSTERTRRAAFDAMADAVRNYLEVVGWFAIVVGEPTITAADRIGLYRVVVTFTGRKTRRS